MTQEYHEPVFIQGDFCYNNAPFERVCINCHNKIGAKSIHQIKHDCKECKIHVHAYYCDTGECVNINCYDKLSEEKMENMNELSRQMLFATKSRIDMMRKDGLLV